MHLASDQAGKKTEFETPMGSATGNQHLVAMPYPGRGHINPMLNFCRLISSRSPNLLITIVVTEEWHGFLTSASDPHPPPNLRFGVIPQVVPSEVGRAKDFPAFIEATLTKIEAPFERLLDQLQPSATAIVYDTYLFWVVAVANRRNIPVAALSTTSASMFTVLSHFDQLVANGHFPLDISERGSEVVDYIPGLPPTAISDLPTFFHGDGRKVIHRVLESIPVVLKADFLLLTSLPELEGAAIDALKTKFSPSTTVLPIGPMIPYFNLQSATSDSDSDYFQWLDTQPAGSVLYISMGSFLSPSAAQMDEIIAGIIDSGVGYLWVTRGEDDPRLKATERGRLVRWCDQLRVLSHRAVGGFWSHCGWNSTSEAAFAGVPVLTYPIFWDQLLNGKTLAEEWRMGRRVRRSSLVTREEIAGILREFMDAAGEGRRNVVEAAERVCNAYQRAVAPGGSAASNLDVFVSRIS